MCRYYQLDKFQFFRTVYLRTLLPAFLFNEIHPGWVDEIIFDILKLAGHIDLPV